MWHRVIDVGVAKYGRFGKMLFVRLDNEAVVDTRTSHRSLDSTLSPAGDRTPDGRDDRGQVSAGREGSWRGTSGVWSDGSGRIL